MEDKRMFGVSGMEANDLGALTEEQQLKLNQFKIQTRVDNEKYLREHPEVACILTGFLGNILRERPESVREFASKYFSDPGLRDRVAMEVAEYQSRLKRAGRQ